MLRVRHVQLRASVLLPALALLLMGTPVPSVSQLDESRTHDRVSERQALRKSRTRTSHEVHAPSDATQAVGDAGLFYRRIAGSGDPVPGVDGETLLWIDGHTSFFKHVPEINAFGDVGFSAGWTGGFPSSGNALFVYRDGETGLLVKVNDPAPGTSEQFTGLPITLGGPLPPRLADADVLFAASVEFTGDGDGLWAQRSGVIDKVFNGYDSPPGTPAGTRFFDWAYSITRSGAVLVNATFIPPGGTTFNNQGFFRDRGDGLEVLVKTGQPAPGFPPGTKFGFDRVDAGLAFGTWSSRDVGTIAFAARTQGNAVDARTDEGVWQETDAGLQLLAREGDAVPGAPDAVFRRGQFGSGTFGQNGAINVLQNDSGHVVFGAHMSRDDAHSGTGLFTTRTGALELLLYANAPGASPPGDQAPGFAPGEGFTQFFRAFQNDLGAIAFTAAATVGPTGPGQDGGLWVERGGQFELVARRHTPAPSLPRWDYTGDLMRIQEFTNRGTLYYIAIVTDGTFEEAVLYMFDPNGEYHILVMTGTALGRGGPARVVQGFVVGFGHSEEDELVVHVIYADESEELFLIGPRRASAVDFVIRPSVCPPELNLRPVEAGSDNPKKGGVIPAVILGSTNLDVGDIDVATVRLEGSAPVRSHLSDAHGPGGDGACACADPGPDGYTDLSLIFRSDEILDQLMGATGQITLNLTGSLVDGTTIEGSACVAIKGVGPRRISTDPNEGSSFATSATPNPFNPTTTIHYRLPTDGHVELVVFDVSGRLVARLVNEVETAGEHAIEWNAGNAPSGAYFYRLTSGSLSQTRKIILLK